MMENVLLYPCVLQGTDTGDSFPKMGNEHFQRENCIISRIHTGGSDIGVGSITAKKCGMDTRENRSSQFRNKWKRAVTGFGKGLQGKANIYTFILSE